MEMFIRDVKLSQNFNQCMFNSTACPTGTWGEDCINTCLNCQGACDPGTGCLNCVTGFVNPSGGQGRILQDHMSITK